MKSVKVATFVFLIAYCICPKGHHETHETVAVHSLPDAEQGLLDLIKEEGAHSLKNHALFNPIKAGTRVLKRQISNIEIPGLSHKPVHDQSCAAVPFKELVPKTYNFESYDVETEDGYILKMFRLRDEEKLKAGHIKKGPILIVHCLTCSADEYMINGELSIGQFLVGQGYDVFFANNRGNKYSTRHKTLDVRSEEFWDFSFQQMGQYDVPAFLKKVQELTEHQKVTYIGHSQGTTQLFAALSDPEIPENKRVGHMIHKFIAVTPIVYIARHKSNFVSKLLSQSKNINSLVEKAGFYKILGGSCSTKEVISQFKGFLGHFDFVGGQAVGHSDKDYKKYTNIKIFPEYLKHSPAGTSLASFMHYAELASQDKDKQVFRKYKYGYNKKTKEVTEIKGEAPAYDLSLIDAKLPIYGVSCEQDKFGSPEDVKQLFNELTKTHNKKAMNIQIKECGHLSIILGLDNMMMYKDIAMLIEKKEQ